MVVVLFIVFALLVLVLYASRHQDSPPSPTFTTFFARTGKLVEVDRHDLPPVITAEGTVQARIVCRTCRHETEHLLCLELGSDTRPAAVTLTAAEAGELSDALEVLVSTARETRGRIPVNQEKFFEMQNGMRLGFRQAGPALEYFLDPGQATAGSVHTFASPEPVRQLLIRAVNKMQPGQEADDPAARAEEHPAAVTKG